MTTFELEVWQTLTHFKTYAEDYDHVRDNDNKEGAKVLMLPGNAYK